MTTMRRAIWTVMAVISMASVSGCQTEDPQAVPGDAPHPFQESVMGANAHAGSIELIGVHVDAPRASRYQPGDNARLWFTLLNEGSSPDVLRKVGSTYAADADIRWDDDCDGQATTVPALTLQPVKPNLRESPPGVPPFDAYHGELVGLNREVPAGTTIPVTFTFDRAGTVTVDALVQPGNAVRPEPSNRCHDEASVRPSAS